MTSFKKAVLIIIAILIVDQIVKVWIKTTMTLGQEFPVFGDWFYIHFVENNGMAFGLEFGGEIGKIFLSLFRIVAVGAIGYYLYKICQKGVSFGFVISVALVFAGAVGNIIDSTIYGVLFNESTYYKVAEFMPEAGGYASILHGKVVDMLYFPLIKGNYPDWMPWVGGNTFIFFRPVFNIADSAITIGILTILLFHRKHFKENKA